MKSLVIVIDAIGNILSIRFIKKHEQKLLIGCPIVIVICLFLSPYIWLYGTIALESFKEYQNRMPFESAKWQNKSSVNSDNPARIRMVDDLLKKYAFDGMSREGVVAILGEPDETDYFREYNMVYWLGPERGFIGIDSEWLVFRLNEQKEVIEYRIVTD